METYLGVDGGGSKTRALLVDARGRPLHYAESGPSNLNACDASTVRQSLFEVVEKCISATGATPAATCFGLAGAGSPSTQEKLESMLQPLDLPGSRIVSDAEIALEGAFTGGPGILLIAGTGSVCLGKSSQGEVIQCGGWGWLADDAGSAGWIGQRALQVAVRQNDGRDRGHALRDAVFAHLAINNSRDISSKIYQPVLTRSQIAELSECVLALAEGGDAPARSIYHQALEELAQMVRTTAERLRDQSHAVALTGGLLTHHPKFRKELVLRLPGFPVQEPASTQLEGAVTLARKIKAAPTNKFPG